jgi:hypothetical protein
MKRKSIILAAIFLLLIVSGAAVYVWHSTKAHVASSAIKSKQPKSAPNSKPYTLQLLSGSKYPAGKSVTLRFSIRDRTNKVFKSFDSTNEDTVMLTVIRKDRTNYQRISPSFDRQTGTLTLSNFQFPTDGDYRLFAEFVAAKAVMDSNDKKIVSAPYTDVVAGDKNKYQPELPIAAKILSSTNGFDTDVFFAPGDDSPSAGVPSYFLVGNNSTVLIQINKNGLPYKDLQTQSSSAGYMEGFGPNLEFTSADAEPVSGNGQSGLLIYTLPLPSAGLYKLFMQTQANNQVSTFDYNVTVKAVPISKPTKEIR